MGEEKKMDVVHITKIETTYDWADDDLVDDYTSFIVRQNARIIEEMVMKGLMTQDGFCIPAVAAVAPVPTPATFFRGVKRIAASA